MGHWPKYGDTFGSSRHYSLDFPTLSLAITTTRRSRRTTITRYIEKMCCIQIGIAIILSIITAFMMRSLFEAGLMEASRSLAAK